MLIARATLKIFIGLLILAPIWGHAKWVTPPSCFPGKTVLGLMNVTLPFPISEGRERHEQVQATLRGQRAQFRQCIEAHGPLTGSLQFRVTPDGDLRVERATIHPGAGNCIFKIMDAILLPPHECDLALVYIWNGAEF